MRRFREVKAKKRKLAEFMKVGLIYRDIARKSYEYMNPEADLHAFEEILLRGDLDEIESYVKVKDALGVVATRLHAILEPDKVRLPKDFLEVIVYSEVPKSDLEEIIIGIYMCNYEPAKKAQIALELMQSLHDEWVRCNSDVFFDQEDMRFRFLQFELIGLEAASVYRLYIDDVLLALKLDVCDEEIKSAYWKLQTEFLKKNSITSRDSLIDYIMKADYNPLTQDIVEILRTDRVVAEKMADS